MTKLVTCILIALLLASGVSAQDNTPTPTPAAYTTYRIIQGDTLGVIAARFHTTTRAILEANNLNDPNLIYWGMELRIPLPPPTATPTPLVTPTPSTTPLLLAPTATEPAAEQTESAPTAELTETPEAPPSPTIVPLPFDLGGAVFSLDHLDVMRDAGMTWMRVELRWSPGVSVSNTRRTIDQAHRNNFKVLLQIGGSAADLGRNPAGYIRDFSAYLGEVATLSPDAIEVWGDMNVESGRISTGAYAQMMAAAFETIKRANPQILVISGALAQAIDFGDQCGSAGCDDLPYLRGMAAAGVGRYADCIGLRYTLGAVAPDATSGDPRGDQFLYYYPTVISAYANAFPTKPLCLTEIGYRVQGIGADSPTWAQDTTEDERAEWLAQATLLARQSQRVLLFVVYNVDAPESPAAGYALVGADNTCTACRTLGAAMLVR